MIIQVVSRRETSDGFFVRLEFINTTDEDTYFSREFNLQVTEEQWKKLAPDTRLKVEPESEQSPTKQTP